MRYVTTVSIAILLSTLGFAQDTKNYEEAFQLVEVWLEAQKDFEKLPGLSAVVVNDQEVLWSGGVGYANPAEGVESEATTLGSICSISKLFTSVAIMKLYDEGKLRLDDEVKDLLPAFAVEQQFEDSGPITVRGLLTHSSGLPREAAFAYWTGPDFPFPDKEQVDAQMSSQETLYPASTYFQYSNLGLTLLGEIVEEISGMPYEEYVQKNILQPLSLKHTRPEMPKSLYGKELAVGYSAVKRSGAREKVNLFDANGITPAAGFSSSVLDLGKFASWQFRLRDTTTTEILKPSTLKNMHRVHWTNPDWKTTWGLGFVVYKGSNGKTQVGHGGSCPGYRSTLRLDLKSKRAYAVIINSSGTNPGKYANGIEAILGKTEKIDEEQSGKRKDFKDYVGYYNLMPWWSEGYVGTWNGKLVMISLPADKPGDAMTFYKHIEGDTFRRIRDDKELGETLVFERDDKGNVTRYSSHGNYVNKMNR